MLQKHLPACLFFHCKASHLTCQLCGSSCLLLPPFCLFHSACRNSYFYCRWAEKAARMPRMTAPAAAWKRSRHCCNTDSVLWFSYSSQQALLNCMHNVKTGGACFYCRSCQPAELIPLLFCRCVFYMRLCYEKPLRTKIMYFFIFFWKLLYWSNNLGLWPHK